MVICLWVTSALYIMLNRQNRAFLLAYRGYTIRIILLRSTQTDALHYYTAQLDAKLQWFQGLDAGYEDTGDRRPHQLSHFQSETQAVASSKTRLYRKSEWERVRLRESYVNIKQKFSNTAPFSNNLTQLPHLRLAGLSCDIMMMIDDSLSQYQYIRKPKLIQWSKCCSAGVSEC